MIVVICGIINNDTLRTVPYHYDRVKPQAKAKRVMFEAILDVCTPLFVVQAIFGWAILAINKALDATDRDLQAAISFPASANRSLRRKTLLVIFPLFVVAYAQARRSKETTIEGRQ